MKIGIISDTHDQIENIKKAVQVLSDNKVELVFHCGDWVSPFSLAYYKDLHCPIYGVFGNNDGDKFRHIERAKLYGINIKYEDRFISTEIDNRKIAVFHGDYEEIVDALLKSQMYDVVLHGHNHIKEIKIIGKTLSVNPGTFMPETAPNVKGASLAIYNSSDNTAQLIDL
ncbi:MAG: metallophosphoesterase [bacterium]|nr:metallophosphoesterase [bacterium]